MLVLTFVRVVLHQSASRSFLSSFTYFFEFLADGLAWVWPSVDFRICVPLLGWEKLLIAFV